MVLMFELINYYPLVHVTLKAYIYTRYMPVRCYGINMIKIH
jgi:hypothetical protein